MLMTECVQYGRMIASGIISMTFQQCKYKGFACLTHGYEGLLTSVPMPKEHHSEYVYRKNLLHRVL